MYIQLTTRCNMHCAHCGMSATARGQDMSLETFREAIQYDDEVFLGGGEPTLHPLFWQFVGLALGAQDSVALVTNGSQTETAIALAGMARRGILYCALSRDGYHDAIDPRVVEAFTVSLRPRGPFVTSDDRNPDRREIRDVTGHEVKAGRCREGREECICPGPIVTPTGDVRLCGCGGAPRIGDVRRGFDRPEDSKGNTYECWIEMRKDRKTRAGRKAVPA